MIKKRKFESAKQYLSLAYQDNPDSEILDLIDLVNFVVKYPDHTKDLLAHYHKHGIDDRYQEILNEFLNGLLCGKNFDEALEYWGLPVSNIITYDDFRAILRKCGNFKQAFLNVALTSKILISKKDDLVEFVDFLIENGYFDMAWSYLENGILIDDERANMLINNLKSRQGIK